MMDREQRPHEAYPVRTVARLTGLSADIIRAWEKRYRVVAPRRGPRGTRLYTADDVRHLRLLGQVVASGRAIGDVAALNLAELEALLTAAPDAESKRRAWGEPQESTDAAVAETLAAIERFDAPAVERRLGDALVAFGERLFARNVVAPLLVEVGNRWEAGQLPIAAEHLTSSALRNLLGGLIRNRGQSQVPTVLLATPSGEPHELGLLLVALLLRDAGVGVYYLGPNLPAREIVAAAQRTGVAVVGIGVVDHGNLVRAVQELRSIEAELPADTQLWLGGGAAAAVCDGTSSTRAQVLDDLERVETEIARLRAVSTSLH